MALTFKTKAAGDITMLDAHARQLLDLIGKEWAVRGVITPEEVPALVARLQTAIAAAGTDAGPDEEREPEAARAHVPLKTRMQPFLEMMDRSARANTPILWGV